MIDYRDRIRGCLIGGAVGDALGYTIEFNDEKEITDRFGDDGIVQYVPDPMSKKAHISDDTQMTMFTANGLLFGDTRKKRFNMSGAPRHYVAMAYQDWLRTQKMPYEVFIKDSEASDKTVSWLSYLPQMYKLRAPGITCMNALGQRKGEKEFPESYIKDPINNSKGCGAVMRVAPIALLHDIYEDIRDIDMEAAEISAITHCHSLGYMTSSVLVHIIRRIIYSTEELTLKEIIIDARNTVADLFSDDEHIDELTSLIDLAVKLSENDLSDLENIHSLGEGWVAEETLAIAIYCSLKYSDDFSKGVISSVNHKGDSDSTGAVTGNILGALTGYDAIEEKWKTDLELRDIILDIADDLNTGCRANGPDPYDDKEWIKKYIDIKI